MAFCYSRKRPTALSPELIAEINETGPVKFIVGASNGHNLWLKDWVNAFPDAALHVSGGIPKKLQLTGGYRLLDESFDNIWAQDLTHAYMPGVPFFNETVFLHKKSKSLIVTDLIQNHSGPRPPGMAGLISRYVFEPIGFKGICIGPPLKMGFMIKDKPGFALAIRQIQSWDFDRIIVTHGDIIDTDAKQVFTSLCERFLK